MSLLSCGELARSIVATRESLQPILDAVLGRLGPEFRKTLDLREIEELSYAEIAERMGESVGTVKSRLSRARSECHRVLATAGLNASGAANVDE